MNSRMNTASVMNESNQVMAAEALAGYVMILLDMIRGMITRAGRVLGTESILAVVLSGIVAFFAFVTGAFMLGSVAGVVFFLAIRPFVN